jgi:hypothetical protein
MSTRKRTTFTQCIEHLGKHSMIPNSAYRKPSTVSFINNSDAIIAEAVNIQHISIFSICEDVRHFSQYLQRPTDGSHRFTCLRQWCCMVRTILSAKSKLLYSEIALGQKPLRIGHMYIYTFLLRMILMQSLHCSCASIIGMLC